MMTRIMPPGLFYEPLVEGEGDESLIEEVNIFESAALDYQARNFQRAYDLILRLYQKNPTRL